MRVETPFDAMPTSAVRLYNTMTQRVETLEPIDPGRVRLYVCGLTTYDHAHAGHARTFIVFDVLVCFLRARGYGVTFVRNVTDVDRRLQTVQPATAGNMPKVKQRAWRACFFQP